MALLGTRLYAINFTQSNKRFALSLYSKGFLSVNATKIYQFKARNSEIKDYALCLGNISKQFTVSNKKKKNRIKRWFFSVAVNPINTNILDIHRYLMKGT